MGNITIKTISLRRLRGADERPLNPEVTNWLVKKVGVLV